MTNRVSELKEQPPAKAQNPFIIECRSCNRTNRIPNPPGSDGVYKCQSCASVIYSATISSQAETKVSKFRLRSEAAKEASLDSLKLLLGGGLFIIFFTPRVLERMRGVEAVLTIALVSIVLFALLYDLKLSRVKTFLSRIEEIRSLLNDDQPVLAQQKIVRQNVPLKIFAGFLSQTKAEVEEALDKHLSLQRALEETQKEQQKIIDEELESKRREELSRQVQSRDTLDSISPLEFERIVLEAFARLGYKVKHTGITGDEGIDGLLDKGGKKIAVQCKRQKNTVGQPLLRDFLGAMVHAKCDEGFFVTTSDFSEAARRLAKENKITLLDGKEVIDLFRETITEDFVLNGRLVKFPKIEQKACPQCGGRMRKQFGRYAFFWGCSKFPHCRYTEDSRRSIFRRIGRRYYNN